VGPSLNRAIAWAEERANPDTGASSIELQSVAQVRLAQYRAYGEPDLKPVLAMLDEQLRSAEVSGHVRGRVEACTLKALALQVQDHRDAASALLERALTLARPEHFVRSIVDHGPAVGELLRQIPRQSAVREYARELLALLVAEEREEALVESRPAGEGTALVEPLTPRELEVLAIIATGASNAEIARELYIAVNTVKTHITHIFGKLGVTRRTEAVARGRELGLID
jgi:LuxR family maltose regulon positive regulatory protein